MCKPDHSEEIISRVQSDPVFREAHNESHGILHLRAQHQLEFSSNIGLRMGSPRLRLWSHHFDGPFSFTAFPQWEGTRAVIRKAFWHWRDDCGRLDSLIDPKINLLSPILMDPMVVVQDADIDGADLQRQIDSASTLRVPVTWPWASDRDSVTSGALGVGFEVYDKARPQARLRMEWADEYPPEWQPVVQWYQECLDWMTSLFPNT
jgi:hypothetical protein